MAGMNRNYDELEKKIGYQFKDINLLITALTHTSFANELKVNKTDSYERLEFLGDAILEYIVSEYLFLKRKSTRRAGSQNSGRVWYVNLPSLRYLRVWAMGIMSVSARGRN